MIPFLPSIPGTSNAKAVTILASVLAALILAAVVGWWTYGKGYESADNKGKAALASREAEYSRNLADAYREAALKQQAETVRANALVVQLVTTKRSIEAERSSLRGRIEYVTRDVSADCVLPADAVRLWNEARRLSAPGVPQTDSPGGAAGQTPAAAVADAGIQQGASIADGMANWVDYVKWCEGVVTQRDKLQELVRGWAQ